MYLCLENTFDWCEGLILVLVMSPRSKHDRGRTTNEKIESNPPRSRHKNRSDQFHTIHYGNDNTDLALTFDRNMTQPIQYLPYTSAGSQQLVKCAFNDNAGRINEQTNKFCFEQVATVLSTVSSVATFESTDVDAFRQSLRKTLKVAVEESRDCRILLNHIDWKHLLQNHDSDRRESTYSSPLEELVQLLLNPTVVPMAYSGNLCIVLLRVMLNVDSTGAKWTPSDKLLLLSIQTLRRRVPTWYLSEHVQQTVQSTNIERLSRCISILRQLAKDDLWFGSLVMKCLLAMVQCIDNMDLDMLTANKTIEPDQTCWYCEKFMRVEEAYVQRNKRQRFATLDQMHDEEWETRNPSGLPKKDYCTCFFAIRQIQKKARLWTKLPLNLVVLRLQVYQKIISVFGSLRLNLTMNQDSFCLPGATMHILRTAIDMSCKCPSDPSLRLSILLMTDSIGIKGYQYTLNYLWERCVSHNSVEPLRIMTEILMESSHYNNPAAVWKALRPMAKYIEDQAESGKMPNEHVRVVLAAFCSILAARKVSASQLHWENCPTEEYDDFVRCVIILKRHYDIAVFWISPHLASHEQEHLWSYLRCLGVLPFAELRLLESRHPIQTWPFDEKLSVRAAHRRMSPHEVAPNLFSKLEEAMEAVEITNDKYTTPIMDYLNDDVLRVIFSYLSYKPLGAASRTCHAWRHLIDNDSVWEKTYRARYTVLGTASQVATAVAQRGSWKMLFQEKLLAQKELRFQRSPSTGFKYRTCNFCGCLQVLRSLEAMERHTLVHNKRASTTKRKKLPKMANGVTKAMQPEKKQKMATNSLPTDAMAAIELYLAQS